MAKLVGTFADLLLFEKCVKLQNIFANKITNGTLPIFLGCNVATSNGSKLIQAHSLLLQTFNRTTTHKIKCANYLLKVLYY